MSADDPLDEEIEALFDNAHKVLASDESVNAWLLVTPAELYTLAERAMDVAHGIRAVHDSLRAAPDEPTRRAGYRLDDAIGELRRVHDELGDTAKDLRRIQERGSCPADWGACPNHGATLRASASSCWCGMPGCRTWDYNRLGLPCSETATHVVTGPDGTSERMCVGHAREAATIDGFHVDPPIDVPTTRRPS